MNWEVEKWDKASGWILMCKRGSQKLQYFPWLRLGRLSGNSFRPQSLITTLYYVAIGMFVVEGEMITLHISPGTGRERERGWTLKMTKDAYCIIVVTMIHTVRYRSFFQSLFVLNHIRTGLYLIIGIFLNILLNFCLFVLLISFFHNFLISPLMFSSILDSIREGTYVFYPLTYKIVHNEAVTYLDSTKVPRPDFMVGSKLSYQDDGFVVIVQKKEDGWDGISPFVKSVYR